MIEINKVINGDCLEVMKTMEDNSVDSIVTDPPYEFYSFSIYKLYVVKHNESSYLILYLLINT